jgi:hypothetical protein
MRDDLSKVKSKNSKVKIKKLFPAEGNVQWADGCF